MSIQMDRIAPKQVNKMFYAAGYGALGDGATDDTAAIQLALDGAKAVGGGIVFLPAGTFIVTQLKLRDNVELHGAGKLATTLKLKNSSNTDIIVRHPSDIGLKVGVRHLTVNGNDTNNTQGGFYWNGPTSQRGPSITIENVLITACRSTVGSGGFGALYHDGNVWSVLRDVDVTSNQNAVGIWWKTSDSYWDGVYAVQNGNLSGQQSTVIQAGGGNRFVQCYWGGGPGAEQVQLLGAQGNYFLNCINDSSWTHGYRLVDFIGTPCQNNTWVGGSCTNPGRAADNTYDCFSIEGTSTNNLIVGVRLVGLEGTPYQPTFKGRYAISELNTAGNTYATGCLIGAFGNAATNNLRSGGGSLFQNSFPFHAGTSLVVGGNYTDSANYERLNLDFNAIGGNVFGIYSSKAGTGSVRTIRMGTNGSPALELLDSTGATHWVRFTGTSGNPTVDTNGGILQFGSTVALTQAAPTVSAGQVGLGSTHATTVGAAGGATALPATPLGYLIANVEGTAVKIPYYNN